MDLKGKVAIVTGASSGIGAEFSKILVENGSTVYGLARSQDKLHSIKNHLGDHFIPVTKDITNYEDVEEWITSTFNDEHLPDILVNNAGLGYFADVDELSLKEWHTMLDVNLSGCVLPNQVSCAFNEENPTVCHIANIASVAGLLGNPRISAYNATKFGLRGFSDALYKELRFDGIKVTCFYPGSIATNFFDSIDAIELHNNMMQPVDIAKTLKYVLEPPDNFLINEIVMRPLNPKPPSN